ncbi:MAG: hypothetical protein WCY33_03380 [Clostridia bacterium]
MANYLYKKYKGEFRVKADYDLSTNDFPRDEQGNIEPSFDDYYIPCASKSKIRHYEQNILLYFCPSIGRFRNILRKIYEDKVGNLDKFTSTKKFKDKEITSYDYDSIQKELLDKQILVDIEEYEDEGEFRFKTDLMEYIAELVKARTSGANISPLSKKNLPSAKYNIPEEDLIKYRKIIEVLEREEMYLLAQWSKKFDKVIQSKKGKLYDVNTKRKRSCLSGKEYIHSIGLFNDYLEFLQKQVITYQKKKNVR